jgi:hypothetical protein
MAKRFNLPFTSLNFGIPGAGEAWEAELWDSEFSGAVTEVTGKPEGLRIEWDGDPANPSAIMPSSCTYSILIEEEADMALITALAGAAEGRFKMVVRRAGSSEVYWAGWVQPGECSYPDDYYDFHFDIYATDGIARLANIDYMDGADFYEGTETVIQHIVKIIEKIDTADVGTWPTARIRSTANRFSEDMNTTTCPLNQATVMHDRFEGKDKEGNNQPWSAFAVLEALLRPFDVQLLHEGGMFHIRQLAKYADATQKAYYYDATGAHLSTAAAEDVDIEVTGYATPGGMVKKAGGLYTFNPALKEVCVDYHHRTSHNRATGSYWDRLDEVLEVLPGVVLVDAADTSYLKGSVTIRHRCQIGINPPGSVIWPTHRWRFRIQVRIPNGAGTYYYLSRETAASTAFYNIEPEEMAWQLTADNHDIVVWSHAVTEADNNIELQFTVAFTSPDLYTDFDGQKLEMKVELDGIEATNGTDLTIPGGNYVGRCDDWNTTEVWLSVEEEGIGSNPDNETWRTCSEVTGDNSARMFIDTYLGDGPAPFSLSAFKVAGVATELWKINNTGTGYPLAQLLAEQILRFRKRPQPIYQGAFIHPDIRPYYRFVDNDKAWMASRITLSAFENTWSGDFVLMDADVDGITTGTPFIPDIKEPSLPPGHPLPPNAPTQPGGGGPGNAPFPPFNPLIGGTLPGFVNGAESAPVTLTADLLASDYNTTRELPVAPVPYAWARKGDRLVVVNAITGHRETFTVGTSYVPNASTITMSGSDSPMEKDFPYGSFVKLKNADELRVKGWSYLLRNQTGEYVTIPNPNTTDPATAGPGGLLPPTTVYDVATLRERIFVLRGNTPVIYDPDPYDNSFSLASSNRLRFESLPLAGEDVYIVVR